MIRWMFAFWLLAQGAQAQDGDLTIVVGGALFEHGGAVEVSAIPVEDVSAEPVRITLEDRFARITLRYPAAASYTFRFRYEAEDGSDLRTQPLSVGSRTIEGRDATMQLVRVLPRAEYTGGEAERTKAAWGVTQRFADPPPAHFWGARALPQVFDTFGDRRIVRMICTEEGVHRVCRPDPEDALLMEALWWREIAEGRLGRLEHNALRACYDGGGLLGRPKHCEGVPGRGWPEFKGVR